ncbi:hypothetical protein BDR26DRAFT_855382 [Obelidium mucronatum]|nr:hypothetical protein BDR26DRAFT_855382 [Obelidium mucronatum]
MFDIDRIHGEIARSFPEDRRVSLYLASFIAYLSPIQNCLFHYFPGATKTILRPSIVLKIDVQWEERYKKYSKTAGTLGLLSDSMLVIAKARPIRPINIKLLRILSRMGLILDAMIQHKQVEDLQVQGLNALAALIKTAQRLFDANTTSNYTLCIGKVLKLWKDSVQVSSAACNCIGMFSFVGVKVDSYIVTLIVEAMEKFHYIVKFQITACFALAHISITHSKETKQDKLLIEKILSVMERFPRQRNVLTTAVFGLGSFSLHSDANRLHIMSKNGIQLIIRCMLEKQFEEEANCLEVCMKHIGSHDEDKADHKTRSASKAHLLKLFGAMCLMNLSENEKCRQHIIHCGALHAIYEAGCYVYNVPQTSKADLSFVMTYVFRKITGGQSRFYSRQAKVPSLQILSKNSVLKSLKEEFDKEKPIFIELKEFLGEKMSDWMIPSMMQESLFKFTECKQCKTLFDSSSGITGHEIYGKEKPTLTRLCSFTCFSRFDLDERKKVVSVVPCFEMEEIDIGS